MSNDRAFDRCLEAFIQRDYAGCVREGMPLLPTGLPLVLLQLVLISLQRLGQTVRARELGGDILAATEQEPWDHLLSMLTLDQAHLIDVLAQRGTMSSGARRIITSEPGCSHWKTGSGSGSLRCVRGPQHALP